MGFIRCSAVSADGMCVELLQYVAVCCSVLQCVAVCCSAFKYLRATSFIVSADGMCVDMCCSVLQCIVAHCIVLQCTEMSA